MLLEVNLGFSLQLGLHSLLSKILRLVNFRGYKLSKLSLLSATLFKDWEVELIELGFKPSKICLPNQQLVSTIFFEPSLLGDW